MVQRSRRLSSGPGLGLRIAGVIVALLLAAGGALLVAVSMASQRVFEAFRGVDKCVDLDDLADIPLESVPGTNICGGWTLDHIVPLQLAVLLLGGGLMLYGAYLGMLSVRAAVWLEGTVLRARGAFRPRTVDLATAEVAAGMVTHTRGDNDGHYQRRRVPRLVARDPASGRRLTLALQGAGMDRLPPAELRALADAMTAGRPESDVDVWRLASQLRQMADNPLDQSLH